MIIKIILNNLLDGKRKWLARFPRALIPVGGGARQINGVVIHEDNK
jgi:hypothetical protein